MVQGSDLQSPDPILFHLCRLCIGVPRRDPKVRRQFHRVTRQSPKRAAVPEYHPGTHSSGAHVVRAISTAGEVVRRAYASLPYGSSAPGLCLPCGSSTSGLCLLSLRLWYIGSWGGETSAKAISRCWVKRHGSCQSGHAEGFVLSHLRGNVF